MIGLVYAKVFYNATGVAGYSIPAAEHSSIISWGKKNESKAYKNMINKFLKKDSIVAVVSDSYDLFHAIEFIWGDELKQDIINSEGLLVIRPDSGNPLKIVMKSLNLLNQKFGSKINNKGYKVLNNVRIIQGDGVDDNIIKEILMAMKKEKYSIDNIAFGMGAALLQKMDRDTFNFAMKNSYVKVNGKGIDVFKNPITDSGKRSKKGRITTVKKDNKYKCILLSQLKNYLNKGWTESLEEIFYNGKILKIYNFEDI
jgi:nicotinamide phosphoribosyltransferase